MEKIGVKVVVIGGGTGSFTLLNELKNYTHNITALVNMADDGGSTGTLRDELGVLPPGDVRKCLAALSSTPKVRDLFNYRFEEGSLRGHAFGNLFMAALEKMTGNFADAVETASEVLSIKGRVEPMTLDNITLIMETSDGSIVRGEENVSYKVSLPKDERPKISLEPKADINPEARKAILEADLVVIAPGLLYTSIAAALVVDGVKEALELIYCDTFDDVFESVKNDNADYGLTAIENSLYGSIHLVYDLLLRNNFWISGETTLQIHQQLITHPNTNLLEVTEVYSHPVALDQCRHWLSENLPHSEIIEAEDTAGAVEYIKSNNLRRAAAIASSQAATNHEMHILAPNIEDEKSNFTRFIVIGRERNSDPSANKASLSLTAHHKPGALYGALGILSNLSINLTKLESRPIRNQKFLYQFIIDLETDSQKLSQAVHELKVYGCEVTVLGHFVTY